MTKVICDSWPEIDVLLQKMAPSPEHDNEPKAPDKSDSKKSGTGANKLSLELLDLESFLSADQVSVIHQRTKNTLFVTILFHDFYPLSNATPRNNL